LISNVPVKNIQDFEEQFLLEMENKYPEILAEFKKGNLPEEGLKKMVELAKEISHQFQ
jgi:F-type H+-transporting ATPase subunit alpha